MVHPPPSSLNHNCAASRLIHNPVSNFTRHRGGAAMMQVLNSKLGKKRESGKKNRRKKPKRKKVDRRWVCAEEERRGGDHLASPLHPPPPPPYTHTLCRAEDRAGGAGPVPSRMEFKFSVRTRVLMG